MKNLKILIAIVSLLLISTACSLSIVVPAAPLPPENPTEFVLVYLVMVPSDNSETEIALFAHKSTDSPTITFAGGKSPSIEDVKQMSDPNPFPGFELWVISPNEWVKKGATDDNGHLNTTVPFTGGTPAAGADWYCENYTKGYSTSDHIKIIDDIQVFLCSR